MKERDHDRSVEFGDFDLGVMKLEPTHKSARHTRYHCLPECKLFTQFTYEFVDNIAILIIVYGKYINTQ